MTNVVTAAGTQFSISATLPATHDLAGFEALTFTDIGELVDGGSAGKTFNKVDHSPLGEREVLSLKGSFSQGTRSLSLGRDIADAGQVLILAALEVDDPYAFRIVYQNGDIDYLIATVDSYTDDIGTIDTIVGSTVAIAQREPVVRNTAGGVLSASVIIPGVHDTDGTFPATQAATSGNGSGAEFTVTIAIGVVVAIDSIDQPGDEYLPGDTITLAIPGAAPETSPTVLEVDSITPS